MSDGGLRVGFLGAGRMATALARAWVRAGRIGPSSTLASDPLAAARVGFEHDTGCPATADNRAVARHAVLLLLAVKPQTMSAVLAEVREEVARKKPLVVSIAAGITLGQLAA